MKRVLAALAIATLPVHSFAAFDCTASVKNVLVYSSGMVNVFHTGRNDYTMVCSMNGDFKGVSSTTCAAWVGMLQAIKRKNGVANFYYADSGSCATLPTYGNSPAPVYIGDVTP